MSALQAKAEKEFRKDIQTKTMQNKSAKRKSILAAAITLGLSLPGAAGCGAKEASGEPDRQCLPQSLQTLSYEEHLDISVGYWNIDGMAKAIQPDDMTRYIEELFNITLHPTSVTWSNYKERYQILSATDSLPDLFATLTLSSTDNNDSATFTDMIETGSIRALPKDLRSEEHTSELQSP